MNTRRQLLVALGRGLLAVPLGSFAQPRERVWRVGVLAPGRRSVSPDMDFLDGLVQGLRELGYAEGKNLSIEWRFADGKYEHLPRLAAELVKLRVDVIVSAAGTPAALAAQKATKTIPIVFVSVGDPVASGLVNSLAHPGANATGLSNLSDDIAVKQMEMLGGMVHGLARVAVLWNPANQFSPRVLKSLQVAALATHMKVLPLEVRTPEEIESAFTLMSTERPGALVVTGDSFIFQQRGQIAERAAALRLPSMGAHRGYAEAGGLMSYGTSSVDNSRRTATYVDRILKGANPGDLPVEQPTKFELVINRRTAKALSLEIPAELLLLAGKVIQ